MPPEEQAAEQGTPTPEGDATTVLTSDVSEQPASDAPADAGEQPAADAAGDAGEDQGSPESYADFNLPEGVELDAALLERAVPVFQELGLTQDQAQKIVDMRAAEVQAESDRQIDSFNQLLKDWLADSKADAEIGGDNFEQSVKVAQNAINKFGTPELKQLLDQHGVGNHPEMIRFMARVGATLREDNPGGEGDPSQAPQDRVSILYPTANTR